ncbi:MAG TPA: hypothetical protein VF277_08000, partial [Steroidobacteraceae bacterium]
LDPAYAQAWALLAVAQRNRLYTASLGDNGLAAAARALELDPRLAEAHAARAGALAAAGQYVEAEGSIATALQLDPESPDVHREAGRLAMHQRRHQDAAVHFEKAFALVDTDVSAGSLLITCYNALGDAAGLRRIGAKLLERCEKALAKDADNGSVMAAMFTALLTVGEHERARDWARRAVLMDPDNLGMRYNIACDLIVNVGDLDLAIELLTPVVGSCGREQLEWLKSDPDMDPIRADARFQSMVAAAEQRLGATRT